MKSLHKYLKLIIITITCVMVFYGGCINSSAGYYTSGISNQTINLWKQNFQWIHFPCKTEFTAGPDVDYMYDFNDRYLMLPNQFRKNGVSSDGLVFNNNYTGFDYDIISISLTSHVTPRAYYVSGYPQMRTKYVLCCIEYKVPSSSVGASQYVHSLTHYYLTNLFCNDEFDGSGYLATPTTYETYNAVNAYPDDVFFGHFYDWVFQGSWNLEDNFIDEYPTLDPADNFYYCKTWKIITELYNFNALIDVDNITCTNGLNLSIDIETEDPCGSTNICDCNCGYYTQELKEELIDYFDTNFITKRQFEAFVDEYFSGNLQDEDYSELSVLQGNTEFSSQISENYSNQDDLFSGLDSYASDLDTFESQLTISPEVRQSASIISDLFSKFPASVIVALVFVLVIIVVVKLIGR